MAISTQGAILKYKKASEASYSELSIKSFPDMGAAPNLLETTTLSDAAQQFIEGVKPMSAMEFTANYDKDDFAALAALESETNISYQLIFGANNGTFSWTGSHTVIVAGGGVNAVVDMKLSVLPDTVIVKA